MIDWLGEICYWLSLVLPPIVFGVTIYMLRSYRLLVSTDNSINF